MAKLRVNVGLLNKRSAPVNDTTHKNIAGEVRKDYEFESVDEYTNGLGIWYKDRDNYWYWGGGLEGIDSQEPVEDADYPWWIKDLKIDKIWSHTKGENVRIAVLDSGYNTGIRDLSDGIRDSKVFFNSRDGSAVGINDIYGHGSHCASLIGGRNKAYITGCAPESELYIAKIASEGSVKSFDIIVKAIKWAIEKRVDIISISYGGESADDELEAIIKSAVNDHNIVVIASIGDIIENSNNSPCYPALFPDCIAVGATNKDHKLSIFGVVNSATDIYAPGENISGYTTSSEPEPRNGTSQSTAIVAGICALIISRHKSLDKRYSVKSICNLITQNADGILGTNEQKMISPSKIFENI